MIGVVDLLARRLSSAWLGLNEWYGSPRVTLHFLPIPLLSEFSNTHSGLIIISGVTGKRFLILHHKLYGRLFEGKGSVTKSFTIDRG